MSGWWRSSGRSAPTASGRRPRLVAGHGHGGRTAGGRPSAPYAAGLRSENRVRVGHVDRERVVNRLCAAVGEGRLTLAESVERQAAAYAARYSRELDGLLADLPVEEPDTGWIGVVQAAEKHLRQTLVAITLINVIALCLGLSSVPGAAGVAALLSGITIMLVVVAAECLGGLRSCVRACGPPRRPTARQRERTSADARRRHGHVAPPRADE
jgi:hypothetical protein